MFIKIEITKLQKSIYEIEIEIEQNEYRYFRLKLILQK